MGKRTSSAAAAPATKHFQSDYVDFDDNHSLDDNVNNNLTDLGERFCSQADPTPASPQSTPAKRVHEDTDSALLRRLKTPRHKDPKPKARASFDMICLPDGSACCVQEGLPALYHEITSKDLYAKGSMLHIPGVFVAKASEGCWVNRPHSGRRRGVIDNAWRPTILGQSAIVHGRDNVKQFIELDIVPDFNVLGIQINVLGEASPLAATIWVRMSPFSLRGGTDILHPTIVDFRAFDMIFDIPCWVPRDRQTTFDPKPILEELQKHSCVIIKRDDQPPPDLN